jgi:hypothetical protein
LEKSLPRAATRGEGKSPRDRGILLSAVNCKLAITTAKFPLTITEHLYYYFLTTISMGGEVPLWKRGRQGDFVQLFPSRSLTIIFIGNKSFVGGDWLYKIRISDPQSWFRYKRHSLKKDSFKMKFFIKRIEAKQEKRSNSPKLKQGYSLSTKKGGSAFAA